MEFVEHPVWLITKQNVSSLGSQSSYRNVAGLTMLTFMVDGHCSPEVINDLSALGVDGFILGTSALFRKGKTYAELIKELR